MGAGLVATGDKGILAIGNGGEGVLHGSGVLDPGRIGRGAAQDKVVIHKRQPLTLKAGQHIGITGCHELLLLAFGVDQEQVSISALGIGNGLAGTGRGDLYRVAVGLLKDRQQIAQQAGVIHRGGGRQTDHLRLLGGLGYLGCGDRRALTQIEEVLTVVGVTVLCCGGLPLLGEHPVDEGSGPLGVNVNIGHSIAVRVHKGRIGIDGQEGVVVDHVVVGFVQNRQINSLLLGRIVLGRFVIRNIIYGRLIFSGILLCARGQKCCKQGERQQEDSNFFHHFNSISIHIIPFDRQVRKLRLEQYRRQVAQSVSPINPYGANHFRRLRHTPPVRCQRARPPFGRIRASAASPGQADQRVSVCILIGRD